MPVITALASASRLAFALIILNGVGAFTATAVAATGTLMAGADGHPMSLSEVVAKVTPGTVIVIGENHENRKHRQQQLELLTTLRGAGFNVSVGMEFLDYPDQGSVDLFTSGQMNEADFLKNVGWANDFNYYRDQILFPSTAFGRTFALNIPRTLTTKVSKGGLTSLNADELALIPPHFEKGNSAYEKRFSTSIAGHLKSPEDEERHFLAQSLWDDTMAWQTSLALTDLFKDPKHVFVIIVGEFHVAYGGGLPDRSRARGVNSVITVSQINTSVLSHAELEAAKRPTGPDGVRADVLWLSAE